VEAGGGEGGVNKSYCDGLFMLHDQHGFPLSVSMALVKERGLNLPASLEAFVKDARRAGWRLETIVSRVREAVVDNFSPAELADQFFGKAA